MDITQYPDLQYFQWERPNAENPRLSAPISSTDTTINVTNPPLNEDGEIVSKAFLMGIKNKKGYTETIYVPANAVQGYGNVPDSTNLGLQITGVTRGINTAGIDFTTGSTTLAIDHNQDEPVFCNVSALIHAGQVAVYQGTVASGGADWQLGRDTDEDITVYAYNGDATLPFWRYDSATSGFVYSNDGVSSTPFGTGAGVTGDDGIDVTAGAISVDTADTNVFVSTSSGAGDSGKIALLDASGDLLQGFLPQAITQTMQFSDLRVNEAVKVTATSTEINQALDGISVNVTDTNLNTLTAGSSSDADSLHTHDSLTNLSEKSLNSETNSNWYTTFAPLHPLGWNNSLMTAVAGQMGLPTYEPSSSGNRYINGIMFHPLGEGSLTFAYAKDVEAHILLGKNGISGVAGWGFVGSSGSTTNYDETQFVIDTARFYWDETANKLWAVTSDNGVGVTATDVTSSLPVAIPTGIQNKNLYRIKINAGISIEFWVDGTLAATHTTNLPNSDSMIWEWGCYHQSDSISISGLTWGIEL